MKYYVLPVAIIAVAATSCIDDSYDLSDIDTTSRLQVNDLTIPVNIDEVTLGDIITFNENSKIKPITIDGSEFYALSQSGDFSSEGIYIEKVSAKAPTLPTVSKTLNLSPLSRAVTGTLNYPINEMGNDFSYSATGIDTSIDALTSAEIEPLDFSLTFNAPEIASIAQKITLKDINIALPLGLTATTNVGSYNAKTGLWVIPSIEVSGTTLKTTLTATGVDMAANGATVSGGSIKLNSQFRVKSGELIIEPKTTITSAPPTINFSIDFTLTDLTVTSMTGRLSYKLDGMSIDPISLSDIPEFLKGEDTNISLTNPQIYLGVNNPVALNNLSYSTGLRLSAMRKGHNDYSCMPDNGPITIGYNNGVTGPYNFVMSPEDNGLSIPAQFANGLQYVKFSGLSSLLATPAGMAPAGLPESINVELVSPQIPLQNVERFTLGRTIDGISGSYELVAPIALTTGAVVVYSDREDGWNDDDIDALTITRLRVSATATNNCPVAATLRAYPIDKNGNRITGVEIKSLEPLAANSANQEIVIEMTGTVTHLDGIIYEATLTGSAAGTPLSPAQTVVLSNIRATVSGYYDKKL